MRGIECPDVGDLEKLFRVRSVIAAAARGGCELGLDGLSERV